MSENIDRITSKILNDAKKEANRIKAEYQKKIKEIEQELKKKIEDKKDKEKKRIDDLARIHKEREISQEEIRLRLEFLNHRYELLNKMIANAVSKLPKSKKYFQFLTEILEDSGWKEGEILLSPEDKKKYGTKLLKWTDKKGLSFELADHDQKIDSGLIIRRGKEAINASISTIVDELREEILTKIAAEVKTDY